MGRMEGGVGGQVRWTEEWSPDEYKASQWNKKEKDARYRCWGKCIVYMYNRDAVCVYLND